jgi:hypothetical protein
MKFGYIVIIFPLLISIGLIIPATHAVEVDTLTGTTPTVTVTNYTITPSIMMPGDTGTITVTLRNTANTATSSQVSGPIASDKSNQVTTDINIFIQNVHLEGDGIKVLSSDFQRVGAIGPGQSIPITFSIQAPLASGMYFPEVWIDVAGGTSTRYPVPVNVNTTVGIQNEAILVMQSTVPDNANPGDEIPVTLTVTNTGQTLADDVVVQIANLSGMIAPQGADLYHLGTIPAGGEETINLVMLSYKNAQPGLIRIPVSISYNEIDGTQAIQQTGIDIVLLGRAEIGFVSVDTNPERLAAGTPFELTIRIENTGTGDAKQVAATVDLPAEGTKEAFIGHITPGNDAPALFLLEGMKGGNYPYNLTVSYTDDMGAHTLVSQMNLYVPPTDATGTIIFGLIVLGIIGFVAYRYWYLPKINGDGKFPWDKKN